MSADGNLYELSQAQVRARNVGIVIFPERVTKRVQLSEYWKEQPYDVDGPF